MIIKKNQTTKILAGKSHIVWDYPMPSSSVGFSYQEIHGASPDGGWWKNIVCEEWYYVLKGSGIAFIEGKRYPFEAGDLIVLPPKKKHRIIGNNACLIAITKPDWYQEQAEIIKE